MERNNSRGREGGASKKKLSAAGLFGGFGDLRECGRGWD